MGYWKEELAKEEERRAVATHIAIEAGAIRVCEFHGETFEGEEEPQKAYRFGNSRFSTGKLKDVFESRIQMTDEIKEAIADQPQECTRCVAFRYE